MYGSGSLTVTPAALTITADNKTKVYGTPLPPLTASYTGFVNGDTTANLTVLPSLSTTATATSNVGPYPITASGAIGMDYTISYVNGVLTIVPSGNSAPVISSLSLPGWSDKGREGNAISLTGNFTDGDPADTHSATVQWGDGSPTQSLAISESGGIGTMNGTHVYVDGGVYSLIVTLTDSASGTATATAATVITGAGRRPDGTLEIIGSNGADGVLVYRSGTQLAVSATFLSVSVKKFPLSNIQRIIADLCEGNDVMAITNQVTVPAIVRGGEGNDILTSGGGVAALLGGDGTDVLYAGAGRSLLIGGRDRDFLWGGPGDDVLLGGTSNLDDNNEALLEVLGSWNSPASYANRVAAVDLLLGDVDDLEGDQLTGGSGRDLFFDGLSDVLTDRKSSGSNVETVL